MRRVTGQYKLIAEHKRLFFLKPLSSLPFGVPEALIHSLIVDLLDSKLLTLNVFSSVWKKNYQHHKKMVKPILLL